MENRNTTITGRIWKAGKSTLVLTITKAVMETLQIKNGDIVQATITKTANAKEKEMRLQKAAEQAAENIENSLPEVNVYKPKVALKK